MVEESFLPLASWRACLFQEVACYNTSSISGKQRVRSKDVLPQIESVFCSWKVVSCYSTLAQGVNMKQLHTVLSLASAKIYKLQGAHNSTLQILKGICRKALAGMVLCIQPHQKYYFLSCLYLNSMQFLPSHQLQFIQLIR